MPKFFERDEVFLSEIKAQGSSKNLEKLKRFVKFFNRKEGHLLYVKTGGNFIVPHTSEFTLQQTEQMFKFIVAAKEEIKKTPYSTKQADQLFTKLEHYSGHDLYIRGKRCLDHLKAITDYIIVLQPLLEKRIKELEVSISSYEEREQLKNLIEKAKKLKLKPITNPLAFLPFSGR